ncbi:hypothetical protein FHT76_008242 [Rhizobium sp. BK176]|nr:hypothetical protein [Rhizobium sp. BK399]MCS3743593.1 hypothetical protein [Rhizobium sp. BK661]MCS4096520.1 hypothetical protein [Rhizobium sp. BK176]
MVHIEVGRRQKTHVGRNKITGRKLYNVTWNEILDSDLLGSVDRALRTVNGRKGPHHGAKLRGSVAGAVFLDEGHADGKNDDRRYDDRGADISKGIGYE